SPHPSGMLFLCSAKTPNRTEMIPWPIGEHGLAINKIARHRPENPRIIRACAMIPHHEVLACRNSCGRQSAKIRGLRRNVRFRQELAIEIHLAFTDLHDVFRQSHDALDERLRAVQRIPKEDHIAPLHHLKPVDDLVDENSFLIGNQGGHAGSFYLHWLVEENNDDYGETQRNDEIAPPTPKF